MSGRESYVVAHDEASLHYIAQPDPFVISFHSAGQLKFYRDGRVQGEFTDPDEAAKTFIEYVVKQYQAPIENAHAEARIAALIAETERLKETHSSMLNSFQRLCNERASSLRKTGWHRAARMLLRSHDEAVAALHDPQPPAGQTDREGRRE
ncbi:hypothetical protein AAC691_15425 [Nguyenibacter vanlangensis]|uniref:Uncharacterized protein n=1 Tax=Nguyenibacter vanlangensis TaxID=1216886 RepID=A0ABZ3D2C6_9PROT